MAYLGLRSPALQSCEPFQTKLSPGIVASHELSDEALPDLVRLVRGLKAIPVLFVPKFDVCELSERLLELGQEPGGIPRHPGRHAIGPLCDGEMGHAGFFRSER